MQGRYSIHAPLFVRTLLHHFVSQEKAPPGLYRSSGGGSVVIGLASMLIVGTVCSISCIHTVNKTISVVCVWWPCCTSLHGRRMCKV